MKKLNAKEHRFVEEYLTDLDPKRAAIAAGYSTTMAASKAYQWVSNGKVKPHVFAAIAERMEARAKRTEITQDMVLRELARIGFADIRRVVTWGDTELRVVGSESGETAPYHGLALIAAEEIDDDTAAAIAEVSQGKEGLRVKLHDKRAALVDMGRHLGMFRDKVEHTGKDGGPIQSEVTTKVVVVPAKQPAAVETKPLPPQAAE